MIATALLALAPVSAKDGPTRAADIAALRTAKLEAWPGYYQRRDGDGLAAFLADGFVAMSADGSVETKAEAVAWVRANNWPNAGKKFRYDISGIAFYGRDAANVYGVGSFDGAGPNGACRMRYTSANIFVRQAGRWRPRFSHTSSPACAKEKR